MCISNRRVIVLCAKFGAEFVSNEIDTLMVHCWASFPKAIVNAYRAGFSDGADCTAHVLHWLKTRGPEVIALLERRVESVREAEVVDELDQLLRDLRKGRPLDDADIPAMPAPPLR